jgi:hypothetical protein
LVQLINPFGGNVKTAPIDVPEAKVKRYLDKGWSLAEGETFDVSSLAEAGPRELDVNKYLKEGLNQHGQPLPNDGIDAGARRGEYETTALPEGSAVKIDERQVHIEDPTGTSNLAGLSGKSRDQLIVIATEEGVGFDPDATKPTIKAAIEAKREAAVEERNQRTEATKTFVPEPTVDEDEADAEIERALAEANGETPDGTQPDGQ